MIGDRFGWLTVFAAAGSKNGKRLWHCDCACGNMVVVATGSLRSGNSTSCGCSRRKDDELRFWSKVDRRNEKECWPWLAKANCRGYGACLFQGKLQRAPRIAWELTNGPIPNGMMICHRCDNPPCVNPSHLFLGTNAINAADMRAKGRSRRGIEHGASKLTEPDVRLIKGAFRTRKRGTQAALARRFRVTDGTIFAIWHGTTWGHV